MEEKKKDIRMRRTNQTSTPSTTSPPPTLPEKGWMQQVLGARSRSSVPGLVATHINIFVYAFAFWLQQPVLGFITKSLGGSAATFGMLQSFFSVVQLVGGPIMGSMADSYSPRTILALSIASGGLSYGLLAVTHSLPMLFASKIPSVAMHAMLAAQACVSILSAEDARSVALGRLSLSYGVGMVSGSGLGGTLSRIFSLHAVAALASLVSFLCVILTFPYLPASQGISGGEEEDKKKTDGEGSGEGGGKSAGLLGALGASLRLLVSPHLGPVMVFVAGVGLALSMQRSTFAMMADEVFGMSAEELGWVMSYGAALALAANVIVVPLLTSAMSEVAVSVTAAATLGLGFVGYAQASSRTEVLLVLIPLSFASATLYTVTTAVISKVVPEDLIGSAIGLRHGLGSALGVIAPLLGNSILDLASPVALAYTCAALAFSASLLGHLFLRPENC